MIKNGLPKISQKKLMRAFLTAMNRKIIQFPLIFHLQIIILMKNIGIVKIKMKRLSINFQLIKMSKNNRQIMKGR